MRDDWRLETLGDISEVIMGRQLSPSKKLGTRPRRYIRAANIGPWGISLDDIFEMDFTEEEETRFACQIGDTLLVEGGNEKSVGCPGLVTEKEAGLCIQNTVIRCRVKNPEVFHPQFQYYVLRNLYWRRGFAELCAGTTIMHLGQKRAELVRIPLPPLPEQKRIVDLISSVDSYINALQKQLKSATKSRKAVLHELLSAGGDDWNETSLGQIAEVIGGGTPSTSNKEYWDGDIVWLTPTEITSQDGKTVSDSLRKITPAGLKNSGAQMLPKGSVILSSRASVGFVALAGRDLCTNQGFQSLIPKQSILGEFLMFWIQQNRSEFESRSAGSTFKEISKSNVKSIKLSLPPLSEQKRIVDIIQTIDDLAVQIELCINKSKKLRFGLLSDLLNGQNEIPSSYDDVMSCT